MWEAICLSKVIAFPEDPYQAHGNVIRYASIHVYKYKNIYIQDFIYFTRQVRIKMYIFNHHVNIVKSTFSIAGTYKNNNQYLFTAASLVNYVILTYWQKTSSFTWFFKRLLFRLVPAWEMKMFIYIVHTYFQRWFMFNACSFLWRCYIL